jgi:hypothetical protein
LNFSNEGSDKFEVKPSFFKEIKMEAKEQNKLIGILLMVHGALQGAIFLILAIVYGLLGIGLMVGSRKSDGQVVGGIFLVFTIIGLGLMLLFVLPQILGGWKMFKEKSNARTWGIAGSILALLFMPLGTVLGIFGLIFLCGNDGKRFYYELTNRQYNSFQTPPPNSWR